MNLLTLLFRLPLLPVRAVVQLAEIIAAQAEDELTDPASVRHELEEAEAEGLTGAELAEVEEHAVSRIEQ